MLVATITWCLMMHSPERIEPECIRVFASEGWCLEDLKSVTGRPHFLLQGIKFWCQTGALKIS
jgi:hypothetical protein